MGIKTNRGNAWENRTVRYMLTNPTYAGKVRWSAQGLNDYHKTDGHTTATMIVDGTHEPIISPEEFEAAQQKIQKYVDGYRSKSDLVARREHGACMLQGIVKCSACGGTLSRASYIYFNCVRYVHGKCSVSHSISIAEAEKMILWAMHQQFDALDFTFAPRENTQVQAEKEAILSQIRHEQEMLARCKEAYIAGVDTLAEYSDNKSAAKAKIERLQNQLSELHEPEKIDGTAFAAKHREALQILDDPTVPGDEKSRVIRTFVDHIVFYRSTKSFKIIYKA
jgi:site-specific DNA recombinase